MKSKPVELCILLLHLAEFKENEPPFFYKHDKHLKIETSFNYKAFCCTDKMQVKRVLNYSSMLVVHLCISAVKLRIKTHFSSQKKNLYKFYLFFFFFSLFFKHLNILLDLEPTRSAIYRSVFLALMSTGGAKGQLGAR